MAEPLKNQFGPGVVRRIAEMIQGEFPAFRREEFVREVVKGYDALALMPRARKISETLRVYLPGGYPQAIRVLLASLGPPLEKTGNNGMSPFLYLPHVFFVAEYGLDDFEISMQAQYELTQRFTAEFSIRPYLEKHPDKTLAMLRKWAKDPSVHVRRLVSEGTRPRLPWAPRLREFQRDPAPVLSLLELLKDDPELYVRRSVANNLNDIGKDHPALLVKTAKQWLIGASENRRWVVRHALRSAVKRGEGGVLGVMGCGAKPKVTLKEVAISPARARRGESVCVSFDLVNDLKQSQKVLVDLRVHFVKANGKSSPKVFKVRETSLAPRAQEAFRKSISLAEMTTRKHYLGAHLVEVLINGESRRLGSFSLVAR